MKRQNKQGRSGYGLSQDAVAEMSLDFAANSGLIVSRWILA
jgi:hypothetical protein